MHDLLGAELIRALVISPQELVSYVVRLGILLEHALIQVISRHILKVLHPQLLSLLSSHSFIPSRVVRSLEAIRARDQEVDLQVDLVVGDLRIHLLLSKQVMVRLEFSP